jgi:hypothetical protein
MSTSRQSLLSQLLLGTPACAAAADNRWLIQVPVSSIRASQSQHNSQNRDTGLTIPWNLAAMVKEGKDDVGAFIWTIG